MRGLKSPLVALIAVLVMIGPISGRMTQIDPNDPMQISTPSAWERSHKETIPVAEPAFQFSHSGVSEDSDLSPRYSIGDAILLTSPMELALVEDSSMTVIWELQSEFEILNINTFTSQGNPLNPRIAISGENTCLMLDATNGVAVWEKDVACQRGSINLRDNGQIQLNTFSEDQRTIRILNEETGEDLWSHTYAVNTAASPSFIESSDHQLFFISTETSVDAVSIETGEVVWSIPIVAERGIMLLKSHILVLQNESIIALDISTGDEMWLSFLAPDYRTSSDWAQPATREKLIVAIETEVMILDVSTGLEITRYENAAVELVYWDNSDWERTHTDTFILRIGSDSIAFGWESLDEAWRVNNSGGLAGHYYSNDHIRLMTTTDGRWILINAETGVRIRTIHATDANTADSGNILLFQNEKGIEAWDSTRKKRLWGFTPDGDVRRWSNNSEHVVITTGFGVHVLDARTGAILKETTHPEGWRSYLITSRFMIYLTDSDVFTVHHLSGGRVQLDGAWDLEGIQTSSTGEIWYLRYNSMMTMIDANTGKQVYSTNQPIDFTTDDGSFIMLDGDGETRTLKFIEPTGDVRWELNVPADFSDILNIPERNKILLQSRTRAYLINAQSGEIIMELPLAYDPDGDNDTVYISDGDAVLVGSAYASAVYEPPTASIMQLIEETTVRGAPSVTGVARGTFPAGTSVFPTGNVMERSDGIWIEVIVEDVTGWVHEDSLPASPTESATPRATPTG